MEKEQKKPEEMQEVPVEEVKEVVAEVAPEGAAEKEPPAEIAEPKEKLPIEIFRERIRASRPEAKYDEDEQEYGRNGIELFDEMESKGKKFDILSKQLKDRFDANPDEAQVYIDYLNGMPLVVAIRKNLGDEALTMKEGDEGWDEYVKAGNERQENLRKNMEKIEEIKANAKLSEDALKEFASEHNMSEEDALALSSFIENILPDIVNGKISKDLLGQFKRARDYDKDIESAREQGKIDGRNERIEIQKKRMEGSGLPNANGGGNASEEDTKGTSNATAEWLKKFYK